MSKKSKVENESHLVEVPCLESDERAERIISSASPVADKIGSMDEQMLTSLCRGVRVVGC